MARELKDWLTKKIEKGESEISVREAHRLLENGNQVLLVDVRTEDERAEVYIKGSTSIPMSLLEAKAQALLPKEDVPVVVYCAGGTRSLTATRTLKNMGYPCAFSMTGGIKGWIDAGYEVVTHSDLTVDQLQRYSRHILLREVGMKGQSQLLKAKVLLVGAGGLGCPAGLYLAAAGVGTLGVIDSDMVDVTNLQRQILHGVADIGRPKTESAKDAIHRVNPEIRVVTYQERLIPENALEIFSHYDIVVDGADNFPTKYLVNDASFFAGKPYVYGGVFQFEGQASVFSPNDGGPCLRCLFPEPPPEGLVPTWDQAGVLGVVPGQIGLLQATEVIKLILKKGKPLIGRFLIYNSLEMGFNVFSVKRNPSCLLCNEKPKIKQLIGYNDTCAPELMRPLAGGIV